MIKQVSSEEKYRNPWMSVREDIIERKSGALGIYGVIEKIDFASIIAIQDGKIQLVQQFRYPIQQNCIEIPMGAWNDQPDTDPKTLALAELREETGYHANSIEEVGFHYVDKGSSKQRCHVFLATELTFVGTQLDKEEEDLISFSKPLAEFEKMIIRGEILDATSIASFALAKLKNMV